MSPQEPLPPRTIDEWDHAAIGKWNEGLPREALILWDKMLDRNELIYPDRQRIEANRRYAIEKLADSLAAYPYELVQRLDNREPGSPRVTLVIFTCKRLHLFTRTMNSFLRCCTDSHRIGRWLCIDDNSGAADKEVMKALYPFVEFVFKSPRERGHPRSLNMLEDLIADPYTLLLEDDWLFVTEMDYVHRSLEILDLESPCVSQVLFNRHYIEVPDDSYLSMRGGVYKEDRSGRRYILHEYFPVGSKEYAQYCARYPDNFAHQKHFTTRPSLIKTEVWKKIGPFVEDPGSYFEQTCGQRYVDQGMKSCYLDAVACIHIGRLNRHKTDPDAEANAYQLNDMPQYGRLWPSNFARTKKGERRKEKVALTVTTCRRLPCFLRSMSSLLSCCKDPGAIDRFLIVDDGSSDEDCEIMKKTFPFFEILRKPPSRKGHAASMNVIIDETASFDYLLHTEDDWLFESPFSIGDCVSVLQDLEVDQLLLLYDEWRNAIPSAIDHVPVMLHRHSIHDRRIPPQFARWREELRKAAPEPPGPDNPEGCWWPSLSLNPGIWKLSSFRACAIGFDEQMDPSLFEYAVSYRLAEKGFKVAYSRMNTSHMDNVSAYVLNDTRRSFDDLGCANHRSVGGNPDCPHCREHLSGTPRL